MRSEESFKTIFYKIICVWIIWGMLLLPVPIPFNNNIDSSKPAYALLGNIGGSTGPGLDAGSIGSGEGAGPDMGTGGSTGSDVGYPYDDSFTGNSGPFSNNVDPASDWANWADDTSSSGDTQADLDYMPDGNTVQEKIYDPINNTYTVNTWEYQPDIANGINSDQYTFDGIDDPNSLVKNDNWVLTNQTVVNNVTSVDGLNDSVDGDFNDVELTLEDGKKVTHNATDNKFEGDFEGSLEEKSEINYNYDKENKEVTKEEPSTARSGSRTRTDQAKPEMPNKVEQYLKQQGVDPSNVVKIGNSYVFDDPTRNALHRVSVEGSKVIDTIYEDFSIPNLETDTLYDTTSLDSKDVMKAIRNGNFGNLKGLEATKTVMTFEQKNITSGWGPDIDGDGELNEVNNKLYLTKIEKSAKASSLSIKENKIEDDIAINKEETISYNYMDTDGDGTDDVWSASNSENVFGIKDGLLRQDADFNYKYVEGGVIRESREGSEKPIREVYIFNGNRSDLRGKSFKEMGISSNHRVTLSNNAWDEVKGALDVNNDKELAKMLLDKERTDIKGDTITVFRVDGQENVVRKENDNRIAKAKFTKGEDDNLKSYKYIKGNKLVIKGENYNKEIIRDLGEMVDALSEAGILNMFSEVSNVDVSKLSYAKGTDRVIYEPNSDTQIFADYTEDTETTGDYKVEYGGVKTGQEVQIFAPNARNSSVTFDISEGSPDFQDRFNIRTFEWNEKEQNGSVVDIITTEANNPEKAKDFKITDEGIEATSTIPELSAGKEQAIKALLEKLNIDSPDLQNNLEKVGKRWVYNTSDGRSIGLDLSNFNEKQDSSIDVYEVGNNNIKKATYGIDYRSGTGTYVVNNEPEKGSLLEFGQSVVNKLTEKMNLTKKEIAANVNISGDENSGFNLEISNLKKDINQDGTKEKVDYRVNLDGDKNLESYAKRAKTNDQNEELISVTLYDNGTGESKTLNKDQIEALSEIINSEGANLYKEGTFDSSNDIISVAKGDNTFMFNLEGNNVNSAFEIQTDGDGNVEKVKVYTNYNEDTKQWKSIILKKRWIKQILRVKTGNLSSSFEEISGLLKEATVPNEDRVKLSFGKYTYWLVASGGTAVNYAFEKVEGKGLTVKTDKKRLGKPVNSEGKDYEYLDNSELTMMAKKSGFQTYQKMLVELTGEDGGKPSKELLANMENPVRLEVDKTTKKDVWTEGNKYVFYVSKDNISMLDIDYGQQGEGYKVKVFSDVTTSSTEPDFVLEKDILNNIFKEHFGLDLISSPIKYSTGLEKIADNLSTTGEDLILQDGNQNDVLKFYQDGSSWKAMELLDGELIIHNDMSSITKWNEDQTVIGSSAVDKITTLSGVSESNILTADFNYDKESNRITVAKQDSESETIAYTFALNGEKSDVEYGFKVTGDKVEIYEGSALADGSVGDPIATISESPEDLLRKIGIDGVTGDEAIDELGKHIAGFIGGDNVIEGEARYGSQLVLQNNDNYHIFNLKKNDNDNFEVKEGENNHLKISKSNLQSIKEKIASHWNETEVDDRTDWGSSEVTFEDMVFDAENNQVEAANKVSSNTGRYKLQFNAASGKLENDKALTNAGQVFKKINKQIAALNINQLEWSGDDGFYSQWKKATAKSMEKHFKEKSFKNKIKDLWGGDDNKYTAITVKSRNKDSNGNFIEETIYVDKNGNVKYEFGSGQMLKYDWNDDGTSATVSGKLIGAEKEGKGKEAKVTYKVIAEIDSENSSVKVTSDGGKAHIKWDGNSNAPFKSLEIDYTQTGDKMTMKQSKTYESSSNRFWNTISMEITKQRNDDGEWVETGKVQQFYDGENFESSTNAIKITYDEYNDSGKATHRTIKEKAEGVEGVVTAEEKAEDGNFWSGTVEIKGKRINRDTGEVVTIGGEGKSVEVKREEFLEKNGFSTSEAKKLVSKDDKAIRKALKKKGLSDSKIEEFFGLKADKGKEQWVEVERQMVDSNGDGKINSKDNAYKDFIEGSKEETKKARIAALQKIVKNNLGNIGLTPDEASKILDKLLNEGHQAAAKVFTNMLNQKFSGKQLTQEGQQALKKIIQKAPKVLKQAKPKIKKTKAGTIYTYDKTTSALKEVKENYPEPSENEGQTGQNQGKASASGQGGPSRGGPTQKPDKGNNKWKPKEVSSQLGGNLRTNETNFKTMDFNERIDKLQELGALSPEQSKALKDISEADAKELYLKALGVRGDVAKKIATMSDKEARAYLKALGFSEEEIQKFLKLNSSYAKKQFLKKHGFKQAEIKKLLGMSKEEQKAYLKKKGFTKEEINKFMNLTAEDAKEYYIKENAKIELTDAQEKLYDKLFGENKAPLKEREAFLTGLGLSKEKAERLLQMDDEGMKAYLNNEGLTQEQISDFFDLENDAEKREFLKNMGLKDKDIEKVMDMLGTRSEEYLEEFLSTVARDISLSEDKINGYIELVNEGATVEEKRAYLEALGVRKSDINNVLQLSGEKEIEGYLAKASKFSQEEVDKLMDYRASRYQKAYLMGIGLSEQQADEFTDVDKNYGREKYLTEEVGLPSWLAEFVTDPTGSKAGNNMDKVIGVIKEAAKKLGIEDLLNSLNKERQKVDRDKGSKILEEVADVLWDAILSGIENEEGEKIWLSPDSSKDYTKNFLKLVFDKAGHSLSDVPDSGTSKDADEGGKTLPPEKIRRIKKIREDLDDGVIDGDYNERILERLRKDLKDGIFDGGYLKDLV